METQIELLLRQSDIDKKKLSELTGFTPNQVRRMFKKGMTIREARTVLQLVNKDLSIV